MLIFLVYWNCICIASSQNLVEQLLTVVDLVARSAMVAGKLPSCLCAKERQCETCPVDLYHEPHVCSCLGTLFALDLAYIGDVPTDIRHSS